MMGIYIKGMEMPTGKNGTLIFAIRSDGRVEDVMGCYIGKAVPVPAHGRLIDADATDIYRREERAFADFNDSPFSEYLDGYKDGLHEAAKRLSTTPTIIPAEEDKT